MIADRWINSTKEGEGRSEYGLVNRITDGDYQKYIHDFYFTLFTILKKINFNI